MSNTPEYLKQPEHVERANQFITQVNTTIANKYSDLLIDTFNSQEGHIEAYNTALRERSLIGKTIEIDPKYIERSRQISNEAEIEAVDRVDVGVIISREINGIKPAQAEQIKRVVKRAKEEIEQLARSFGGEKDELVEKIIQKVESIMEDYPQTIFFFQHFVFRRK